MKKITSLLAMVFCMVSLTSCNDVKSDEFNQTVADETVSMLTDYYQGMRTADFDLTFSHYAEFYQRTIDEELDYYGGSKDEYISADNATWYTNNYGEDVTISLDVKSTSQMTNSVVKKYNDLVVSLYYDDADITNVYNVSVDKTISGSLKTDTSTEQWTILEIDDKLWLYDTYFEDMVATQSTSSDNQPQGEITYVVE